MAVLSFNPNTHVVRVLVRSAVDNGLRPQSGQTKDNKIGIYCFSTSLSFKE